MVLLHDVQSFFKRRQVARLQRDVRIEAIDPAERVRVADIGGEK